MDISVEFRKTAFKKKIQTIAYVNNVYKDENTFFSACLKYFSHTITKILKEHLFVKVNSNLIVEFVRKNLQRHDTSTPEKELERIQFFIQSKSQRISRSTNIEKFFTKNMREFHIGKIEEFTNNGSDWSLDRIVELLITSSKCEHFQHGSSYIKLPNSLKQKKAIINVKNFDNQCFKWAVLSALFPNKIHAERVIHYKKYQNKLNFKGVKFPVKINDIGKFERNNSNISINVYAHENKSNSAHTYSYTSPIRITKKVKKHHINLLLIQENVAQENSLDLYADFNSTDIQSHYCWIKNMSRLVKSQLSKNRNKVFICNTCLQHFRSDVDLKKHNVECDSVNDIRIDMPDITNKWLSFQNFHHQLKCPFIIYADTECLLESSNERIQSQQAFQKHVPFSIGYYFKYIHDDKECFYASHTGKDCVIWFVNELCRISSIIDRFTSIIIPIQMSKDDEQQFANAVECSICNKTFYSNEMRVREHCHFTGAYRGVAHQDCNLNFKEHDIIPIVFHNLQYDSHFIIEKIANYMDGPVHIIPLNSERYISFTKKIFIPKYNAETQKNYNKVIQFRFIDSFRFMASSLADLVSYLPAGKFYNLNAEFKTTSEEKISLLKRKGVFPYDYMDSMSKLELNELPEKKYFFSKLLNCDISEIEYLRAQNVWQAFNIKTLKEYAELYLKTDVLLLADIFENFRSTCLDIYKLDPAHYYTAPALSWDSMLKFTCVRLELITDVDQLLFVEKGDNYSFYLSSKLA